MILSRIWTQGRFDGNEIAEGDLLQGIPIERLGDAKSALEGLCGVLRKKPHTGCGPVYTGDSHQPIFKRTSGHVLVYEQIRTNNDLKKALIDDSLAISTIDEGLKEAIDFLLGTKIGKTVARYSLQPLVMKSGDAPDKLGAILEIVYICPKASKNQPSETQRKSFTINGVSDLDKLEGTIDPCKVCKHRHKVKANGRLF